MIHLVTNIFIMSTSAVIPITGTWPSAHRSLNSGPVKPLELTYKNKSPKIIAGPKVSPSCFRDNT